MNESKSFWTTLPGILTGIAMIIAATGGLIGGLYAAGIIGDGPEPAPAPAPVPMPAPTPVPAPAPAPVPAPPAIAAFTVSALTISPTEVNIAQSVTISVDVTNTGDLADTYEVILKIDNTVISTKQITLASHASQKVTFTTSKDVAGIYAVYVSGLSGTFTVRTAQPPSTDIVYITRTGAKYHRAGCRYLSQSCIQIERAEAIRRGYTPCSVCRP